MWRPLPLAGAQWGPNHQLTGRHCHRSAVWLREAGMTRIPDKCLPPTSRRHASHPGHTLAPRRPLRQSEGVRRDVPSHFYTQRSYTNSWHIANPPWFRQVPVREPNPLQSLEAVLLWQGAPQQEGLQKAVPGPAWLSDQGIKVIIPKLSSSHERGHP